MKVTYWNIIKKEYLEGATPKELAAKYNLKTKTISDKANKDKWTREKSQISENIREKTEERIEKLTSLALRRLEDVLTSEETKTGDLISAIGKALEISGLKRDKLEVKNITPQIVVADEIHKDILEQIRNADLN